MSDNGVRANPDAGCPAELVADQRRIAVRHVGFDGALHDGVIEVHRAAATDVAHFFARALELQYPIDEVVPASAYAWDDDALMAANRTSGFNFRTVAGRRHLSMHSFGLAFDVNPLLMPYQRAIDDDVISEPPGATYDPSRPGTLTLDHPLVELLTSRGWTWGGTWTLDADGVTDYHHFQKTPSADERAALRSRYGLADDA